MFIYFTAVLIYFIGGLVSEFVGRKYKLLTYTISSVLASSIFIIYSLFNIATNNTVKFSLYLNFPFNKVDFVLDQLALFFVLIISLGNLVTAVYAKGYLEKYIDIGRGTLHFISMALLSISMIMVVSVSNALFFLVVWEIMSLASFVLVAFEGEKKEVMDAAVNYLIAMHIGVLFIIAAFAFGMIFSGSFTFEDFAKLFSLNESARELIFILSFIGFGTKAGFFPFHSWLPKAHPAAPSHISAMMSGMMLKTGIYGILRMVSLIEMPSLFDGFSILAISVFTAMYGIIYAANERDIKKMLAFSSIENIGIIGTGIGVGILGSVYGNGYMSFLGYGAAIIHVLNHSLFKSLLFLSAGSVYLSTHTKNMEEMGGLMKKIPVTATCFFVGAIAISGLPPLNGFISEFMLYVAFLSGIKSGSTLFLISIFSFSILGFVGTYAILTMTKGFSVMFLGNPRVEQKHLEVEKTPIKIALIFYSVIILLVGIFPQYILRFFQNSIFFMVRDKNTIFAEKTFNTFNTISLILLIFIALVIVLAGIKKLLLYKNGTRIYKTWNCGYQAANSRMEYTASSFSNSASEISRPILITVKEEKKPDGLFPEESFVKTQNKDIVDIVIFKYVNNFIEYIIKWISKIQSRTVQQYVIYLIVFIIISFMWIISR